MFWIENKSLSMAFYKDLCICLEELSTEGKHRVRDTTANVQRARSRPREQGTSTSLTDKFLLWGTDTQFYVLLLLFLYLSEDLES